MSNPPILEFENVGYRQQQTQILSDINWMLDDGEHWAVLGPNGSGKTTLLEVACGYLWPSSGRVLRLGEEMLDLRQLRRSIGWVTSELATKIPLEETALETVVTGRLSQWGLKFFLGDQPSEQDFADARALLSQLSCSHLVAKPFGVLSQGERQQVLIARARMAEPFLLVLDEPCAGMDPGVRERFLGWLNEVVSKTTGPTTILVTHHLEEIVPCISQTLMLAEGRIVASGRTHEVVTKTRIEEVYQTSLYKLENVAGRLWPLWK
ncbi:ABC transporter ATP-binding protein [Bythopirellula polymerisocia]|uniref:Putative ABC transporter ATP-binding protein YlmA n=1 Tax=Bythopirellula polymerisocia TaxID=2528003 RepID=A0A5C6CN75_9BACT|nr:ATP-binding cassette domain-containing protein [Bythopirellula polymerisocia]TWU25872.1 putative ABC transporter ATP-binding protein YlmA [Bythopirellula polymerisocia]